MNLAALETCTHATHTHTHTQTCRTEGRHMSRCKQTEKTFGCTYYKDRWENIWRMLRNRPTFESISEFFTSHLKPLFVIQCYQDLSKHYHYYLKSFSNSWGQWHLYIKQAWMLDAISWQYKCIAIGFWIIWTNIH